mmetsp:Transcript_50112/g.109624  ORF Transcript_50112/g.109624 Transcript_50112/m.109624 type:complete len:252 (-) Transcript_50112:657-1412(-)
MPGFVRLLPRRRHNSTGVVLSSRPQNPPYNWRCSRSSHSRAARRSPHLCTWRHNCLITAPSYRPRSVLRRGLLTGRLARGPPELIIPRGVTPGRGDQSWGWAGAARWGCITSTTHRCIARGRCWVQQAGAGSDRAHVALWGGRCHWWGPQSGAGSDRSHGRLRVWKRARGARSTPRWITLHDCVCIRTCSRSCHGRLSLPKCSTRCPCLFRPQCNLRAGRSSRSSWRPHRAQHSARFTPRPPMRCMSGWTP